MKNNVTVASSMTPLPDFKSEPIKHVTCKVCGVLAVPHEHPRVDGTYDSKPSADGRPLHELIQDKELMKEVLGNAAKEASEEQARMVAEADGREWWDDKKYVDIRDPDHIDWDIPAIIAEAVERERDEVYFGEHGKHRRSAN